jgi:isoleucyl-tRNA synthetase
VAARPALDRWVLSRLARLERTVDGYLERYDATDAARAIIQFVDDDVANWYVRLGRKRYYDVDGDDNRAAFATLHQVLVSVCRLLAPIAPFVSDWMHRELVGESVHLAPFARDGAVLAAAEDRCRAWSAWRPASARMRSRRCCRCWRPSSTSSEWISPRPRTRW